MVRKRGSILLLVITFVWQLPNSLTHSLARSLTHSLTHSCTRAHTLCDMFTCIPHHTYPILLPTLATKRQLEEQLQRLKEEKRTVTSNLHSAEERCQSLEDDIRLQRLSSDELKQTSTDLEVCLLLCVNNVWLFTECKVM